MDGLSGINLRWNEIAAAAVIQVAAFAATMGVASAIKSAMSALAAASIMS